MHGDQPQVKNEGSVQVQNIAQYQNITQHFHSTGEAPHPANQERVWNVPFLQNPLFTGREKILLQLRAHFQNSHATNFSQPQALSGLGGVGKTQIALEYAHRYRQEYQAILWSAANNHEALVSGYVAIARVLNLPQKDEEDQSLIVNTVLHWLTLQKNWLLILDNADDPVAVRAFLPTTFDGDILLTTQAQAIGILAHRIEVDPMDVETGTLLLLRRARVIEQGTSLATTLPSNVDLAREISQELGGLPLALDQAGAYLEETKESLEGYLSIYKEERALLLNRRGGLISDHIPVATTWKLAFENIELRNPAAIELIHLFAFLAPDAIPEELFIKTSHHLGPILQPLMTKKILFNDAIKVLLDYSLIQRDTATKTISIHRLVQAVIRDAMRKTERIQWAERVVHIIYEIFPFEGLTQWIPSQRYLSHAYLAVEYIDQWQLTFTEARALLINFSTYLYKHGQVNKVETLLQRALTLNEKISNPKLDSSIAVCLNNLASIYRTQNRLEQAETLLQRALTLNEKNLGFGSTAVADNLNNLANVYLEQDKFEQAARLIQRAIAIREKGMGHEHPSITGHLCNLSNIYRCQGKLDQAELVLRRAIAIQDRHLDSDHIDRVEVLQSLAFLCKQRDDFEQAELLLQRAFTIQEKALGSKHPKTIESLKALHETREEASHNMPT